MALIRHYLPEAHAIIFVVDSYDKERIDEAREFLYKFISMDSFKSTVLLVMANKQDMPNVMTIEEIREKLEIDKYKELKAKNVIGTSAEQGLGLQESLDWIISTLSLEKYTLPLKKR